MQTLPQRRPLAKLLAATLLATCLVLGLTQIAAEDRILLESGGRYQGTIVEENSEFVKIKTRAGVYTIMRDDIAKIVRSENVFGELARRTKTLSANDSDGWYDLGLWCNEQELYPQAIDCFHRVIAADPDHSKARTQLGYRPDRGRWVTDDEYYRTRGWVQHEGTWVSPEDKDRLDQGLVRLPNGSWGLPKKQPDSESGPRLAGRKPRPESDSNRSGQSPQPDARRRSPANPLGGFPGQRRGRAAEPPTPEERARNLDAQKQRGAWKLAISTDYYDIYSNGPEPEVRELGNKMDRMCEQFKRIFAHKEDIVHPFPIWLYASQQEFMSKTGRGQGVGGFYDGRKIVGFHGTLGGLTTQSVLFHEGTHQFQGLVLGRNMWRAKIWFIEGLAVYFEESKLRGKKVETGVIPRGRLSQLKRAINSGSYVPLSQLLAMSQAQFGALHYAHAWGLIYFLVHGTKGGKERFIEYFKRMKNGEDGVKAFEELFDKPLDVIEKHWKEYIKNLTPQ